MIDKEILFRIKRKTDPTLFAHEVEDFTA
ncbi:hypothetical protein FTRO_0350030, partial [Fructobacillus tropaeoli]